MKKFRWIVVIVLVVVCGFGVFALRGFQAQQAKPKGPDTSITTVQRGDMVQQVIETGTIDSKKAVEVKSRVAGRVKSIFVEEGARVTKGQLIAIIDPQETTLQVQQSAAQLRGAQSAVARTRVEIAQRRITSQTALAKARLRVRDLERELAAQPALTTANINQAKSAVAGAKQQLDQLVQVSHPNELNSVQNEVAEAQANVSNAEAEHARRKELFDKGYVSLREVQASELQLELSRRRLDTAKQKLATLENQQLLEKQQSQEKVRQAQAQFDQAMANRFADDNKRREYEASLIAVREAQAGLRDVDALIQGQKQSQASADQIRSVLADSQRQLGETEIRAPITGIVTKKLIEEGELVSSLSSFSSGTPIVRIEDRTSMIVKLNINEIDVARIKLGMNTNVDIDAIPDQAFKGKVTKIAPSSSAVGSVATPGGADPVVKFAVEITLVSSDPRINSGMSAKCTVEPVRRDGVLRVPLEFVGTDPAGKRFVLIVGDPKAKPVQTPVVTGVSSGSFIEIKEGVKEGQTLKRPAYTGPQRKNAFQMGSNGEE